jgi:phosphoribosylaminoimidazolecarboxamide formyltransferase / IMP cyclohydrolase
MARSIYPQVAFNQRTTTIPALRPTPISIPSHSVMRALISVTDKSGIVELARGLHAAGLELLATGGTAALIAADGLPVKEVGELTGAGEILGGRVKTLAPVIFGGILARLDLDSDRRDLEKIHAAPIGIVVCNLYDFNPAAPSIEKIDVGGVALIRAAAKNSEFVAVVTDPSDYANVVAHAATISSDAAEMKAFRRRLAAKAWRVIANYDAAIATAYAADAEGDAAPPSGTLDLVFSRVKDLRYGENPHQKAGWWRSTESGIHDARIVEGKELSYNNLLDVSAAMGLATDLGENGVAIIKHQNPCGAAKRNSIAESLKAALDADRISAFGGVIAISGVVDADVPPILDGLFFEVLIAHEVTDAARAAFAARKNLRIVEWKPKADSTDWEYRSIPGGLLAQTRDHLTGYTPSVELKIASHRQPTPGELSDMRFAMTVAKHVRSNAIVLAKNGVTIGIGAGQMNRADSVMIAVQKAGENAKGAVMASDGFFPFSDGLENAPGVAAVIQPGGSIRDKEVIAAADRLGMALVMTGVRHFKH